MEKLRDKQKERWKKEIDRKGEAADLDEVSMRLVGWKEGTSEDD